MVDLDLDKIVYRRLEGSEMESEKVTRDWG